MLVRLAGCVTARLAGQGVCIASVLLVHIHTVSCGAGLLSLLLSGPGESRLYSRHSLECCNNTACFITAVMTKSMYTHAVLPALVLGSAVVLGSADAGQSAEC
jgi:hypothetical protein